MVKSSDAPLDSTAVSVDVSLIDDLLVPVLEEVLVPSPTPTLVIHLGLVEGQDPFPSVAPAHVLPLGPVGG